MNTYFLTASRHMMFASKQTALEKQAFAIGTSLSALDTLSGSSVGQVMEFLEVGSFARVIVIDSRGAELYNSQKTDTDITDSQIVDYLNEALAGNDVFYSSFSDNAFSSSIFMPIVMDNSIVGAFFLSEFDTYQGEILLGLQRNIQRISFVIALFSIISVFAVLQTIRQRIKTILNAIITVREGEYAYRIRVTGNDELAQLSSEFNDLTSRLQETEELRRRFVADASHELKTPLASIRLLSDSILQNDTMSDEMVREFITDIGDEAARLARTTEKLLALTRLDNNVTIDRSSIDVRQVVNTTIRILNPLAEKRFIGLFVDMASDCTVFASEDEIRHIVLNLIENAIKYNRDGGAVYVSLSKDESSVKFSVDDTGVGIPEADLPYIFDRFYRVDKARSREAGGSGLGLAIVRNTVHELGGQIAVSRRPEGGMRFTVKFPLYVSDSYTFDPLQTPGAETDDNSTL